MTSELFRNALCVSLDVDTKSECLELATSLRSLAGGFKIGPRLCLKYGEGLIKDLAAFGPVFVDCKFFDIPSTMLASVQAAFNAGAVAVTVHSLAGSEALRALAKLESELNRIRPFKILCVSILTSWRQENIPSVMKSQPIATHVVELAQMVKSSGLSGLVCSAEEALTLKALGLFLVTPGIRLAGHKTDDQKRVLGPREAIRAGSSLLVVGRPILEAANPVVEAQTFLDQIGEL